MNSEIKKHDIMVSKEHLLKEIDRLKVDLFDAMYEIKQLRIELDKARYAIAISHLDVWQG